MFVFTMKASGLKFFGVLALSIAILATAISILPSVTASTDVAAVSTNFKNVSTVQDMTNFLYQLGISVDPEPIEVFEYEIPTEFNSVLESYNEIQRSQGLNLKRYLGKDATVYIFKVNDHETDADIFATLFIRNGRVIAGDISSTEGEGMVKSLQKDDYYAK